MIFAGFSNNVADHANNMGLFWHRKLLLGFTLKAQFVGLFIYLFLFILLHIHLVEERGFTLGFIYLEYQMTMLFEHTVLITNQHNF